MAGIRTEVWSRELAEKLYPENSFIMQSKNDSAWVTNKTVNLPNAGARPIVEKNRSILPAAVNKREDVNNSYNIDEYTSSPDLIEDVIEIETSYSKRQSIIESHANQMNTKIADEILYSWSASNSSNIIRTTGDAILNNTPGATGNRAALTLADLTKARNLLDDMGVPEIGRCGTFPSQWINDLILREKEVLMSKEFSNNVDIKDGVINSILGFKIYKRGKNNIQRYTNASTPVALAPSANATGTTNAAAVLWHPDFVRRAISSTKMYYEEDSPIYYGNIISGMTRAGAVKWYLDETGCAAIVESAAA